MSEEENNILERLYKAVINTDEEETKKAAKDAMKAGIDPVKVITGGLAKGMEVIGERFHSHKVFLPEVLLATDAMKAGIEIIKPFISTERMAEITSGKIVIGTVRGDIHDIGKNLVAAFLNAAGFEIYDIGTDCPVMKFLDKAKEVKADIIAMSSLMVTSKIYQQDLIEYLKSAGLRDLNWVMVGGGTVTPDWAREIGADGYGTMASDAVEVAKILMEKGKEIKRPVIKE